MTDKLTTLIAYILVIGYILLVFDVLLFSSQIELLQVSLFSLAYMLYEYRRG